MCISRHMLSQTVMEIDINGWSLIPPHNILQGWVERDIENIQTNLKEHGWPPYNIQKFKNTAADLFLALVVKKKGLGNMGEHEHRVFKDYIYEHAEEILKIPKPGRTEGPSIYHGQHHQNTPITPAVNDAGHSGNERHSRLERTLLEIDRQLMGHGNSIDMESMDIDFDQGLVGVNEMNMQPSEGGYTALMNSNNNFELGTGANSPGSMTNSYSRYNTSEYDGTLNSTAPTSIGGTCLDSSFSNAQEYLDPQNMGFPDIQLIEIFNKSTSGHQYSPQSPSYNSHSQLSSTTTTSSSNHGYSHSNSSSNNSSNSSNQPAPTPTINITLPAPTTATSVASKPPKEHLFGCGPCGKTFSKKAELNRHWTQATKGCPATCIIACESQCEWCGMSVSVQNLVDHEGHFGHNIENEYLPKDWVRRESELKIGPGARVQTYELFLRKSRKGGEDPWKEDHVKFIDNPKNPQPQKKKGNRA